MVFSPLISFSKSLPLFLVAFVLVTSTGSISTCRSSPLHHQQCVYEHFSALLDFQGNLSFWNPESRDCCTWGGIKCDRVTGHVTSLTLNHLNIPGKINLESLCRIQSLQFLNISFNQFFPSPIPSAIGKLTNLTHLTLSSSKFYGKIPPEMSSLSRLVRLDLSLNGYDDDYSNFIPLELESIGALIRNMSSLSGLGLDYVNMSTEVLEIIDLAENQLQGKIPSLPPTMFCGWKKMTGEDRSEPEEYLKTWAAKYFFYFEQIMIRSKGSEMKLSRISTSETIIDLSRNHLEGRIPETIGLLKSLRVLNMSHNAFTGQIPKSFKNMTALESLDLSQNKLSENIPLELSELTFLSVLNLSENQLTGSIPHAKQFSTYTNESFQGNPGLCGPPLSKVCEDASDAPSSTSTDPETSSENYQLVSSGIVKLFAS
ncbi:hypothetical protein ACLOJK_015628 [Asimina triloba]